VKTISRKSGEFFRNCHFLVKLSCKSAKNSKNSLSLGAYLYYNSINQAVFAPRAGTNARGNLPRGAPAAAKQPPSPQNGANSAT